MIRVAYIIATIPAIAAAFIATPWRPNPKTRQGEVVLYFAIAYMALYFLIFHFWLKAF